MVCLKPYNPLLPSLFPPSFNVPMSWKWVWNMQPELRNGLLEAISPLSPFPVLFTPLSHLISCSHVMKMSLKYATGIKEWSAWSVRTKNALSGEEKNIKARQEHPRLDFLFLFQFLSFLFQFLSFFFSVVFFLFIVWGWENSLGMGIKGH